MHQVTRATATCDRHTFEAFVVGEDGGVPPSRGNPLSTRERCHVDDDSRGEVPRSVGHPVAEDKATLRVGVVYLYLLILFFILEEGGRGVKWFCVRIMEHVVIPRVVGKQPLDHFQQRRTPFVQGVPAIRL